MLATPGLFHHHRGKKLLRHQIYIVMRHKIFEYSFTASLPGIISVKGFFFSHTVQVSVNIYIYFFLFNVWWSLETGIAENKKLSKGRGSVFQLSLPPLMQCQITSLTLRERESEKKKQKPRGCGQSAWSRCVFKSPVPREQWLGG